MVTVSGQRFRFEGATYGIKTVPPHFLARLADVSSPSLANFIRRIAGSHMPQLKTIRAPQSPQLSVWFRGLATTNYLGAPTPVVHLILADENGVEGGTGEFMRVPVTFLWDCASFPVAPRRSRTIFCNVYDGSYPTGAVFVGRVAFHNPLFKRFRQWHADPLPNAKEAGDLKLQLETLEADEPVSQAAIHKLGSQAARRGFARETIFNLLLEPSTPNEIWRIQSVTLDDATGNVLSIPPLHPGQAASDARLIQGYNRFSIPATLWPDEAAWRLRVAVKRAYGVRTNEQITFRYVRPISGLTNLFQTTTGSVSGMELVLTERTIPSWYPVTSSPDNDKRAVFVELSHIPAGTMIDFVDPMYGIHLDPKIEDGKLTWLTLIPTTDKSTEFTWIVQTLRTVEFMVKPP